MSDVIFLKTFAIVPKFAFSLFVLKQKEKAKRAANKVKSFINVCNRIMGCRGVYIIRHASKQKAADENRWFLVRVLLRFLETALLWSTNMLLLVKSRSISESLLVVVVAAVAVASFAAADSIFDLVGSILFVSFFQLHIHSLLMHSALFNYFYGL